MCSKSEMGKAQTWYERLGTKEGEQMMYKIAKARERNTRDVGTVNIIRSREGNMLY